MSKLSKNIIYNFFGQGLLLVLGFVAVKYIFKQLGEDALGVIYFTLTMNVVLSAVLEMGICSTTVREISGHFESDPDYIQELIRTFSLFYWVAYALLGIAIYFLAPVLVEKWIHLKTMDIATAIYVLRILGISSLITLPKSFYISILRGLQRMEFNNIIDVAVSGLQQFGTILILAFGGNLFHVVYWFVICYGISILSYLVVFAHFFSIIAIVPKYFNTVIKRNIKYCLSMTSISILVMIHTMGDKVIISKMLPISIFGFYIFAYNTVSKLTLVTSSTFQAAFPSFSALFKAGDRIGMITQYKKMQDLLCFATVPLFAFIPFAATPLFNYLFNAEVAKMLFLPITLLCVGFYMNGTVNIPYAFSLGVGRPDIVARQNFYALFVVLPVTLLLIYYLGLVGAGLSWIFYHLFYYSYAMPRICLECIEIPVKNWYLHVFKIFVLIGGTYGIAGLILKVIGIQSIFSLSLTYTITSVVFLLISGMMIGDDLRGTLVRLLRGVKICRFL